MTQEPSVFIVKRDGATQSKMYTTLGQARRFISDNAPGEAAWKYRQDTGDNFWVLAREDRLTLISAQTELYEIVGYALVEVQTYPPVNPKKTKKET